MVFDSSFLIAVMEHPTTWYEDILERRGAFEPVVLDVVQLELERLSRGGGRRARFASLAKEVAGTFRVVRARSGRSADDELVSWAIENHAAVATVDGGLMERLAALHVPVVTLRGGRVHG